MARIRSIKPEFWKDGKVLRLSESCALFFIGLWNFCDDEGKCPNDSFELASNMPRFKSQHVSKWIQILFEAGLIQLSTDFRWISVTNWNHQKIDRPRLPQVRKSEIEWLPVFSGPLSTNARRMLDDASTNVRRKDRIGKDRIGAGGSVEEPPPPKSEDSISKERNPVADFESQFKGDRKKYEQCFAYLVERSGKENLSNFATSQRIREAMAVFEKPEECWSWFEDLADRIVDRGVEDVLSYVAASWRDEVGQRRGQVAVSL